MFVIICSSTTASFVKIITVRFNTGFSFNRFVSCRRIPLISSETESSVYITAHTTRGRLIISLARAQLFGMHDTTRTAALLAPPPARVSHLVTFYSALRKLDARNNHDLILFTTTSDILKQNKESYNLNRTVVSPSPAYINKQRLELVTSFLTKKYNYNHDYF